MASSEDFGGPDQAREYLEEFEGGGEMEPVPEPGSSPWRSTVEFAFSTLQAFLIPNWHVPDETARQWVQAGTELMDQWFPGGLDFMDEWGPGARLIFATGAIAWANFDVQRMTFRPTHALEGSHHENGRTDDRGHGQEPQRQDAVDQGGDEEG